MFGINFITVGFVLTSIGCSMVACLVMGIDVLHGKGRFSTCRTVNVAHGFSSGIGAGFLFSCLCVVRYDAGAVFVFFSLGRGDL